MNLYKQKSYYVGEYDYLSHIGHQNEVLHKIQQCEQKITDMEMDMSYLCKTLHKVLLKLRL